MEDVLFGHVPDEWKGVHRMHTPGGEQEMSIVSEFGAVRVVDVNGEPWFVAKDVCECLELGNPRTSIALLDEDEKGVHTMDTPNDAVNTHCKKVNKFSYGDMPLKLFACIAKNPRISGIAKCYPLPRP